MPCPLCAGVDAEQLAHGWRLCDSLGLIFRIDATGKILEVGTTQRRPPLERAPARPLASLIRPGGGSHAKTRPMTT